jgi:hypothetical protein
VSYAYGKHALAICDRCGRRVKYLDLRTEWTNWRVCDECWEPKHPQLDPSLPSPDAEALHNPRPEAREDLYVYVGQNTFPPLDNVVAHAVGFIGQVEVST